MSCHPLSFRLLQLGVPALLLLSWAVLFLHTPSPIHAFPGNDPAVFINEIHYDNDGADVNEGVEIAGPAGTNLNGWSLVFYNGSNQEPYETIDLEGTLADQQGGMGTAWFDVSGIQNGAPDGLALVDPDDTVVQFLSYEGTLTATDGPAAGITSTDIGVAESSSTGEDESLQLTGTGCTYDDFTWTGPTDATPGAVNEGQTFLCSDDTPPGDAAPAVADTHPADNATGVALTTTIVITFTEPVTAATDAFVLSDVSGAVLTATLSGGGSVYTVTPHVELAENQVYTVAVSADTIQDVDADDPPDAMAADHVFSFRTRGPSPATFVNEIHYDNAGTDKDEFVEIAGPAGTDLTDWSLWLYNGSNGTAYFTETLAAVLPDQQNGLGTHAIARPANGIQNGDPDGLALVDDAGTVVQFLSYEGTFTAADGPAAGMTSIDVAVAEDGSDEPGLSLQLTGTGCTYADFSWTAPAAASPGAPNSGQVSTCDGPPFTDAAPAVSATAPADGAESVPTSSTIVITFTEAVTATDGAFALTDGSGNAITISVSSGDNVYTITPMVDLAHGTPHVVTVDATAISDVDDDDPPDGMVIDVVFGFVTAFAETGWIINEIHADPDADDGDANGDGGADDSEDEFVEIVNHTGEDIDISGWTLWDEVGARHAFPDGMIVPAHCVVVVFGGGAPTGAFGGAIVQTAGSGQLGLNNGGDTITLRSGAWITSTVMARYTYGREGGNSQSLTRSPDATGTDPLVEHSTVSDTLFSPGTRADGTPFAGCPTLTPLYDIQGRGASSPLAGSTVTVEGVVTGDFQENDDASRNLGGFFVQQAIGDRDPATSDGVFVFDGSAPAVDVAPGHRVRVTGQVAEDSGETQIVAARVSVVGTGSITPTVVALPAANVTTNSDGALIADLERYEGMLVRVADPLTVTDLDDLGRFGAFRASQGGRLRSFTHGSQPSVDGYAAHQRDAAARTVTVDDGLNVQNPDPIRYPDGTLDAGDGLRVGDTVTDLVGVVRFSRGSDTSGTETYRILPTQNPIFTAANPRPATPPEVGGRLRVAGANLHNYFTTLGARGADDAIEFERQRQKIAAMLAALDADVVGVVEIENDASASLQDLVEALDARLGTGTYAFVDTGVIGAHAVKVGLIYKPAAVTPVGAFAVLDDAVDPSFRDGENRPALAQTFRENDTGALFTVVVNHFKSKSSPCDHLGDVDAGDGQGHCNGTRTAAALALVDWLASDPTGSGDADVLIVGDLNAHANEDPIAAITAAGYVDLMAQTAGADGYTYVFEGQAGYLDHALASSSLAAQVTGAAAWHVNADEASVLDYNTEFKSSGQIDSLFAPDPYRASDHDPVLVGLDLAAPPPTATPTASATPVPTETPTPTPTPVVDLIISEIMYDPAGAEPDWEWIEVYNPGAQDVDLSGFVLDDNNGSVHAAANVAGGMVPAGGTAILFNGDALSAAGFAAAWDADLNLVPVSGWSKLSLNNGGDTIGLWQSFAAYTGDQQTHANALASVPFGNGGDWPAADGRSSIFLTDLGAAPRDGSNWALSTVDGDTPTGAAFANTNGDVSSPDAARPAPPATATPTPTATPSPTATPTATPSQTPTPTAPASNETPAPTATPTSTETAANRAPEAANDTATIAEDTPVTLDLLQNDRDADGDALTIRSVTQPIYGSIRRTGDAIRYVPAADFHGTDGFRYVVDDGRGGAAVGQVTVRVRPANDAPLAVADAAVTAVDAPVVVDLLRNDADVDGDPLSLLDLQTPSHASVANNGDGSVTVTPDAGFRGLVTFAYTVGDGNGGSATSTATVVVGAENETVQARDDSAATFEERALVVEVLGNDSSMVGRPLALLGVDAPLHGRATISGTAIHYVPERGFAGGDGFGYTVGDGGAVATARVSVTVRARNHAPRAADDAAATREDTAVTVPVLANDRDADGDALAVGGIDPGAHGAVAVDETGVLHYRPDPDFHGIDRFAYAVSDGNGGVDLATVTVTVTAVNDAPTAVDDVVVTDEDAPIAVTVLANDTDIDGDALTVAGFTQAANGSVTGDGGFGGHASLTYAPHPDFNGEDSFTYVVADGNGGRVAATVFLTVRPVPDAPDVRDDAIILITEATARAGLVHAPVLTFDPTENDADRDGGRLAVAAVGTARHGTVTVNGDGAFTYTPDPGFRGMDRVTYRVVPVEAPALATPGTVTIVVDPPGDKVTATDDVIATDEETPVVIDVLANDALADGGALTLLGVGKSEGSLRVEEGKLHYTPPHNFHGTDVFAYVVGDGAMDAAVATVTVTVRPRNDLPVAVPDWAETVEETPLTLHPLANDGDPDGESPFLVAVGRPRRGTVQENGDGSITYTPAPDFSGTDTFTYTIADRLSPGRSAQDIAVVAVDVLPVNDPPRAADDWVQTDEETPLRVRPLRNDGDPDGDPLTLISVSSAAHGTVREDGAPNGQPVLTYAPAENYAGPDAIAYTVDDGNGGRATATIWVTVNPVNDAPVLIPPADQQAIPGENVTLALSATDADGDELLFYAHGLPPGLVLAAETGIIQGTVREQAGGRYSGTIAVTDGSVTDSATMVWTILADPGGTAESFALYLPHVARPPTRPDLVGSLALEPDRTVWQAGEPVVLRAIVANQGTAESGPFWVDLHINPNEPPTTPPAPWHERCTLTPCYGLAWRVENLAPGEQIVLSSEDGDNGYSAWYGSFAPGTTDLYLLVDSWGSEQGRVVEWNEDNNWVHIAGLQVTGEDGHGREMPHLLPRQ